MGKKFGVPYKGSKSRIAQDIVDLLPANEYFVDLFAGGGVQLQTVQCVQVNGISLLLTI